MIVVDLLNRIVVYLVLDTCLAKMRKQHNSSTTTISSVLLIVVYLSESTFT